MSTRTQHPAPSTRHPASPTTYVLGLGNVLMGDDGWGPAVVRQFESEYAVGAPIEIVDLGTPGLDLSPWLADAERVILVDTVNSGGPPGTLRMYSKADVLRHLPGARVGPHDPGLKEALLALDFAGRGPQILRLIGAVPAAVSMGLELSPPLQAAIPLAVAAIAHQLRSWRQPFDRRRGFSGTAAWPGPLHLA